MISGERPLRETGGRLYQQIEIEAGPFRRVVELGTDVVADRARASYDDGVLRVELPLAGQVTRRVPIDPKDLMATEPRAASRSSRPTTSTAAIAGRAEVLPATLPVLPLKEAVAYPDTLTPLAVGQERSVRLIDDVLAGGPHARARRLARLRARRAGPGRPLRRRRARA